MDALSKSDRGRSAERIPTGSAISSQTITPSKDQRGRDRSGAENQRGKPALPARTIARGPPVEERRQAPPATWDRHRLDQPPHEPSVLDVDGAVEPEVNGSPGARLRLARAPVRRPSRRGR